MTDPTITPDLKLVRQIAREFLEDPDMPASELDYAVIRHIGRPKSDEVFQAWLDAVQADVEDATVTTVATWPDEQSAAEPDACVCGDPNCMPYWRPVHEQMNAMRVRSDKAAADFTKAMLEEICDLQAELDRVRAQREDGQDGDVRAVKAVTTAVARMWPVPMDDRERRQELWSEALDRIDDLHDLFAARVAALDAREAAAGGAHPNGDPIWEEQ